MRRAPRFSANTRATSTRPPNPAPPVSRSRPRSCDAVGVIVILNRHAGSAAESAAVEAALREAGAEPEIQLAGSGGELCALAKQAAASAHETIVAGGGDGTINAVASVLVGTAKRLGVLPLGTLNHFAKDLGIPLALPLAAQTAAQGRETAVDVGEVNGRIFLNNSSLGLYPRIVRDRERQQERLGRGKWPAFAWALLSALHVCPRLRLCLPAGASLPAAVR